MFKKEVNELCQEVGELKWRMDAAQSRITEYEHHEMIISKLLIQTLQQHSQLEAKFKDLENRTCWKNLRVYSVPENCKGNDD